MVILFRTEQIILMHFEWDGHTQNSFKIIVWGDYLNFEGKKNHPNSLLNVMVFIAEHYSC